MRRLRSEGRTRKSGPTRPGEPVGGDVAPSGPDHPSQDLTRRSGRRFFAVIGPFFEAGSERDSSRPRCGPGGRWRSDPTRRPGRRVAPTVAARVQRPRSRRDAVGRSNRSGQTEAPSSSITVRLVRRVTPAGDPHHVSDPLGSTASEIGRAPGTGPGRSTPLADWSLSPVDAHRRWAAIRRALRDAEDQDRGCCRKDCGSSMVPAESGGPTPAPEPRIDPRWR